jgi:hypothetical protein
MDAPAAKTAKHLAEVRIVPTGHTRQYLLEAFSFALKLFSINTAKLH